MSAVPTDTKQGPAPGLGPDWFAPLHNWPRRAARALRAGHAVARVVVAQTRGSTPREVGACMLVGSAWTEGTIGGGRLEWEAVEMARALLNEPDSAPVRVCRLVLGTELGQCCGGAVELWIERQVAADLPVLEAAAESVQHPRLLVSTTVNGQLRRRLIVQDDPAQNTRLLRINEGEAILWEPLATGLRSVWLYGAGHVGQALVRILKLLPLQVTWIDSRAALLAGEFGDSVETLCAAQPPATVASAPPGTSFLIMTHSHALDYELCHAVLAREDVAWAGLIGSASKGARFRARLARAGLKPEQIARLVCPIGIAGLDSKWPAAIAVAIAAQLLQSGPACVNHAPHAEIHCPDPCTTCTAHPGGP